VEREPEMIERDVLEGYVSLEKAKEDYKIILNPQTLKVDEEATKKLRDNLKQS
jgi:N-methylhydantoinase B